MIAAAFVKAGSGFLTYAGVGEAVRQDSLIEFADADGAKLRQGGGVVAGVAEHAERQSGALELLAGRRWHAKHLREGTREKLTRWETRARPPCRRAAMP